MDIWTLVKQFSYRQLFKLSLLGAQKPLYINPTLRATRQTINICDSLYKDSHHKNGKANAFRHALWNVLICRNIFKFSKNEAKSIDWAKKITDLHEKLMKNEPLAEMMDLHNNEIGRQYFERLKHRSEEEIVDFLNGLTKNAKKITEIRAIEKHKNDLVYILES
ncbi:hypothetical protein U6A24_17110 [Aquimarina gracilis]|uniref:DUF6973 domain-containing protein n=1 Tax=Aquimarina gracilis TaxID=874422 RepID=A0ABU5ZZD6_9FLAO|nr:hypothetical protein [Aquimarina gracilis]MEB3347197.1 hypothetical protein [Aquimarina gracilis]